VIFIIFLINDQEKSKYYSSSRMKRLLCYIVWILKNPVIFVSEGKLFLARDD